MRRTLKLCDHENLSTPPPLNISVEDLPLYTRHQSRPLENVFLQELDDVFALGCGLLADSGGHLLPQSLNPSTTKFPNASLARRTRLDVGLTRLVTPRIPEALWITDRSCGNYYHWLLEALLRLFLARRAGITAPLLLPNIVNKRPFALRSLEAMGEKNPIITGRRVGRRVERFLVPEHPSQREHKTLTYSREALSMFAGSIRKRLAVDAAPRQKIYASRPPGLRRIIVDEAPIIEYMRQCGYRIVRMEDFDFAGQVELLAGASHFVTLHGAALSNMIFMPPGGRVMEIAHRSLIFHDFWKLAHAMSLDYYVCLGMPASDGTGADPHFGNVKLDLKVLRSAVAEFEKD